MDASEAEVVAKVDAYPVVKSVDSNLHPMTWLRSMLFKTSTGTSSKLLNPLSLKNVLKASLEGAKTVKGPWFANVVTKSALSNAATKVERFSDPTATSTILLVVGCCRGKITLPITWTTPFAAWMSTN